MKKKNQQNNYIVFILLAFLFGGFLHVLCYGLPFTYCITIIYYGLIVGIWSMTIRMRIVDSRLQRLMNAIAGCEMLYFILQAGRYALFRGSETIMRYMWYGFYVPMIMIPLLFYMVTCYMNERDSYKLSAGTKLLIGLGVLQCLLTLTNDFHRLFFTAKKGVLNGERHGYGVLYFVYLFCVAIIFVLAFVKLIKKTRLTVARQYAVLPILTLCISMFFSVLCQATKLFVINGVRIFNITECYSFSIIVCFEVCIYIGLIQTNTEYGKLFEALNLPIEILPYGKMSSFEKIMQRNPENIYRIETMDIEGGSVRFAYDLTNVYDLNREIENATEQIEYRNDYLRQENELKEEQAGLEKRNALYDQISGIVAAQLEEIDDLLSRNTISFEEKAGKIAVLYSYIKRRSNLELLREQGDNIPLLELKLAIGETLDYLKLNGVECTITISGQQELAAENIVDAYEFFEHTIEQYMNVLTHVVVALMANASGLTLRIMMQVLQENKEQDVVAVSSFKKGGDLV